MVNKLSSNAEGELCILHTPDSLSFIRTIDTWEGHLKEIYSAALGLSVESHVDWKGMYVMDPFATPEAAVEVHVDGLPSLSKYASWKSKIFPLIVSAREPNTFKGLQSRIRQHFSNGRNKVINVKLSGEKKLHTIRRAFGSANITRRQKPKLKHLNQAVKEDRYFLRELSILQIITGKIRSGAVVPDNLIDFYHFRFRTIHLLSDFYGPISPQTKEAKRLLGAALQDLNKAFVKAYDGSVLVTVVSTDVAHTRRSARSVTNPPGHSKKWPHEWLAPPLDWKKYPLKATPPHRRQEVNENEEPDSAKEEAEADTQETKAIHRSKEVGRANKEEKLASSEQVYDFYDDDYDTEMQHLNEELMLIDNLEGDEYKYQKLHDPYATFNILLWFGVVWGFSLLAVVYACMDMDPGRNTIIYRLTTMRTKKEL
ncbi:hypothetical protein PYW08_015935 [Mythimna loreyi]|uniref:Uncharacterized protein n=1 Tax=Mythimna loreyi TaxID=667449 RepID=A0ACC2QSG4_9NEOP|nr:hypothetical protein PYW08_015935 [Mythimna loreyi]